MLENLVIRNSVSNTNQLMCLVRAHCDSFSSLQDFGSIFSTLLPGTSARLSPPEGMTVLDGLEVKVAFGGVWKESLQELSGGQRWDT